MNAAFKWSLLVACSFTLTGVRAYSQTNPPPDPAAPAPEAPPAAIEAAPPAPPPPPPPAPEATTATPQAPMAPTPSADKTPIVPPAQPPLKIETPNKSNIKFGFLLQPQYQAVSSATLDGYSSNLFIRRTRILAGGTLFGVLDYFIDTDFPNLFLANTVAGTGTPPGPDTAVKATPGMNIQDAFITYKPIGDLIKVDMGYMLPPLAHNAVQGATTLYSWDYFAYSFQSGNSFNSSANPIGRDLGLELRGLVLGNHLEYRVGLFQGLRVGQTATVGTTPGEVSARNMFRATGRVQINLLDPETGFFYAGTYLGTKKVLSVGGSFDLQDNYKYFAGDVFADLPLGPAGVVTAQVNVAHWDGGTFITLPFGQKQTAVMGEAGFLIGGIGLSPIFRAEHLWVTNANDQTRLGGGLAFWPYGHNTNIKAFYTNFKIENGPRAVNQINLQWQLYFF